MSMDPGLHIPTDVPLMFDPERDAHAEIERLRTLVEAHRMMLRGIVAAWRPVVVALGEMTDRSIAAAIDLDELLSAAEREGMVA
jgi:hypothetical protein